MHQGKIRAIGRPVDLRQQLARQFHYTIYVNNLADETCRVLEQAAPGIKAGWEAGHMQLSFTAGETDGTLNRILDLLRADGVEIFSISGEPPSLEEVFAHYTAPPTEKTSVPRRRATTVKHDAPDVVLLHAGLSYRIQLSRLLHHEPGGRGLYNVYLLLRVATRGRRCALACRLWR